MVAWNIVNRRLKVTVPHLSKFVMFARGTPSRISATRAEESLPALSLRTTGPGAGLSRVTLPAPIAAEDILRYEEVMMQMRFSIPENKIGLLVMLVALAIFLQFSPNTDNALNAQSPPLPGSVKDALTDVTRPQAFDGFLSSNSGPATSTLDQAIGTTKLPGLPRLAIDNNPTKQITYGLPWEPDNLNPYLTFSSAAGEIHSLILEGMLAVDPDGTVYPVLAQDVPTVANGGVSPDGLTITYTLRSDILWSDGETFTCSDVLFTHAAITHPDGGAVSTSGYDQIQSVICDGGLTVRVEFDEFYPAYYTLFSSILPQHATGDPADMEHWAFNMQPIGTGPFGLDEWVAGEHITLVQNERYRDYPAEPMVDAIVARFIPSVEDGKTMLRSGETDILGNLRASDIPEFEGDTSVVTHIRSSSGEERLVLNLADPTLDATDDPLNNPHWSLGQKDVREAIQLGIDKQAIIDQLLYGAVTVGTSELNTGWARCAITPSVYSTIQANALLTAAGWTDLDGDGVRECNGCPHAVPGAPLRLKIQTTTGNQLREEVEQKLVDMMAEIGIEFYTENVSPSELFGSWASGAFRKHGDFDILMYTTSEGLDPHSHMFGYFHSSNMPTYANGGQGSNYSRWIDAAADDPRSMSAETTFTGSKSIQTAMEPGMLPSGIAPKRVWFLVLLAASSTPLMVILSWNSLQELSTIPWL
jgi:peptide/nickel transport system substrate-binding protein